jgi:putative ABC transport system ATP-binding protein
VVRPLALKKAKGLLDTFDLSARATFKPARLSGGEKQRVSIARALANDPKLILADEPTANLDSRRGREVMRILRGVAKNMGKTVVIVSHDERLAEIADRVLWMEDGRFKEDQVLVVDPNCGSKIEKNSTTRYLNTPQKTYYFCSKECQEEYAKRLRKVDDV